MLVLFSKDIIGTTESPIDVFNFLLNTAVIVRKDKGKIDVFPKRFLKSIEQILMILFDWNKYGLL